MTDTIPDHVDAPSTSHPPIPSSLVAPPPETEDFSRQVGEIFRRLSLAAETFPSQAFSRIVGTVLVALGKAVLEEAEHQAAGLRTRTAPAHPGIKVSASARRVDFDGWDPGDSDSR
ncbi:hypothetical protein MKK70_09085 [Methylobacterium sp. E-041]|uniref:hypothetical protein n=1 Tax=Methylobacterium sp. E-041 TaxID=2836573 RepID=UPI001FB9FE4D|nr:hypothetical protein [Methylobacterium sp. E-041]MCJ2105531.1 hypothetical protein [Methylobacterium sp. E-041]